MMDSNTLMLALAAVVVSAMYLLRRRSRLQKED
jgi:hypothetical protein